MGKPTTPLPEVGKAAGNDEHSVLIGYLDYHRRVLVRKVEGLTDEQARIAACPPSEMTLLGLVRHMTDVERNWFRRSLVDEDIGPIYYGDGHPDGDPDGDFHPTADDTVADALAAFWAEVEICDANIAAHSLDDLAKAGQQPPGSLRRIIVHMIEEYARHCGHADLIREAIDGETGD